MYILGGTVEKTEISRLFTRHVRRVQLLCSVAELGNYFAQCCGMWIRIRIQELVECGSGSTYV